MKPVTGAFALVATSVIVQAHRGILLLKIHLYHWLEATSDDS
jgi:hypothetical protein